jgi:hypothetical protein
LFFFSSYRSLEHAIKAPGLTIECAGAEVACKHALVTGRDVGINVGSNDFRFNDNMFFLYASSENPLGFQLKNEII